MRVSVSDTGQGMSEETPRHAFEPFFTTKGPNQGTGLGLSMVFGFGSLVGGTVTLESAPGQGTTIAIFLPGAAAAAVSTLRNSSDIVETAPARILIVDDDEAVRATTCAMLEELGHNVVAANGASAALSVLRSDRRFDLVVIDYAMPEMSGSELATEIRKAWPNAPLLFVTGYADNKGLRVWTDLGVSTLHKPFSQDELAAAVTKAISDSSSARIIPFRA